FETPFATIFEIRIDALASQIHILNSGLLRVLRVLRVLCGSILQFFAHQVERSIAHKVESDETAARVRACPI
ncbi:MAG: hypothetical protein NTW47_04760, partial [Proteobacteria bacterium]|nr:hypothetical protein [Pseudomonadota bacterium]